jgi:hypothetical protein
MSGTHMGSLPPTINSDTSSCTRNVYEDMSATECNSSNAKARYPVSKERKERGQQELGDDSLDSGYVPFFATVCSFPAPMHLVLVHVDDVDQNDVPHKEACPSGGAVRRRSTFAAERE